ncbi:transcriptional regulator [Paractinoplanes abujensis]|uniref:Transcriptional regulator with XRE-family HTH domain n=1 Tax=Paractinoplanes abujensis TaxID=882441 RepID=A0A7W7CP53_9ACTN|nr:helix-turn-helix transcriptional regulator [Actinoplanes abujensis]MBB4692116.1 transcriptional regulator with XRE-family HTH domain [Actinoplanes abujensis]GID16469.1 transcriptional regulator [Actinoplanes abujensis]
METWEFGRTLRRWRDRVTPEAVGVPAGRRRRASGLRREELAGLAGISADYLTRLEQGRATAPSAQVVEALARALRLADAERDLLYQLAGHATPGLDVVPSRVTPSVQRLLQRLAHTPVVVYDATWTLVLANAPYDALMGDTTGWHGIERNAIWRNLLGPSSRVVHTPREHAEHVARLIADLRLTASRYPADRALRKLIGELAEASPRFAELWESDAAPPAPGETSKHKVIEHPAVGRIALDCDTLVVSLDDLRIMIYTAEPGTEDADRLALATVLGTQSLTAG